MHHQYTLTGTMHHQYTLTGATFSEDGCSSNSFSYNYSDTPLLTFSLPNLKSNGQLPQMETPTATSESSLSAMIDPQQQITLMLSPSPSRFDVSHIQRDQLESIFPDFSSDGFSPTLKKSLWCYSCKKSGHKIRTCRYKQCRDKL